MRILSISGLRGIIGDGLSPDYVVRFAAALGTLADGGTVVVARDGRGSGAMLEQAVVAGLTAVGCDVLAAGIAATPTCGVLVTHHQAAAGLQITASHNPIEWNGLKPFSPQGSVFDQATGEKLLAILEGEKFAWRDSRALGNVELLAGPSSDIERPGRSERPGRRPDDPFAPHEERVLALIDVEAVHRRRFKVVLDCNHGSGAVSGPRLLERLGCDVRVLGGVPDGDFEHDPEPLEKNLSSLCDAVRQFGADVGFAQDPDADRLAIVDERGRYIGEELTLALAADHVLARRPGPVVVNGSTSRATADIAAKHGCAFHRSWVGEAHVVAKMREVGAIIGGEGNGGVIEPRVGFVRDSFAGMAFVLEGLATGKKSLAAWADSIPAYTIVKDKLTCPRERVDAACAALRARYPDATATDGDGLRLDWPDRWVQVRASNTEPILRVIAEAPAAEPARALCADAIAAVRAAVE